jgi:hypothetical protein
MSESVQWFILTIAAAFYTAVISGVLPMLITNKHISMKGLCILSIIVLMVGGTLGILLKASVLGWGILAVTVLSYLVYFFFTSKFIAQINLDRHIDKIVDQVLTALQLNDETIVELLAEAKEKPIEGNRAEFKTNINRSIQLVLDSLKSLLFDTFGINTTECLLMPTDEGRFKVLAVNGFSLYQHKAIESEFTYRPVANCIAGKAMNECRDLIIPDLEDENDQNTEIWKDLAGIKKKGSMICIVIKPEGQALSGNNGDQHYFPLAILCTTATKQKPKDATKMAETIRKFTNKIKILIYFLLILDKITDQTL